MAKRTGSGEPFLSWCIISRNSEATIEATLKSLRERTPEAEIVVVDTCSSDNSPEIAKRYADVFEVYTGPRGTWTKEMQWFDDASAARQRSFEIASGRWRGWIDTDDRLPGPEEVEKLLRANGRWKPVGNNGNPVLESGDPETLESVIRKLEALDPKISCLWAPYLYQKDENGNALVWQTRERIVRWDNPSNYRWAEAAHEILVPRNGIFPPRVELTALLFVHEKTFTASEALYSITRHFDVLFKGYLAGERTTRRCLYLANYSQHLCPDKEEEFIRAAHDAATTPTDRYRALSDLGCLLGRRGLMQDALEAYGAAVAIHPDLPDAWLVGGDLWTRTDDLERAIYWYRQGVAGRGGHLDSLLSPRVFLLQYPMRLAYAIQDRAVRRLHQLSFTCYSEVPRALEPIVEDFREAREIVEQITGNPAIGSDTAEAAKILKAFVNEHEAQKTALHMIATALQLFANDEPLKVRDLLKATPWNLQDHPGIVAIERQLATYDWAAEEGTNHGFYQSPEHLAGAYPAPEMPPDRLYEANAYGRTKATIAWIKKNAPYDATVVDLGCLDGIGGIPIIRACPEIKYVGVDLAQGALDRFSAYVKADPELAARDVTFIHGDADSCPPADVIIWNEVIEHVPNPRAEIAELVGRLRPGGRLLISTPWGAVDPGRPNSGHLRAMLPRDLVQLVDGIADVEEAYRGEGTWTDINDNLLAVVSPSLRRVARKSPANIIVPTALWDWNGRTVEKEGIGASEEMIVYLAEALAEDRKTTVYGPVPNEDVHRGVQYLPREAGRKISEGKILISRNPGYPQLLKPALKKQQPLLLWLQDAVYPGITAELVECFERIVVVSEWHKRIMHERHQIPLHKMDVLYNFILPEHFSLEGAPERKKDHFIYASSPDRGLVRLLEMWPKIRERLPNATLDVFYGWRGCEKLSMMGASGWKAYYEHARKGFEERKNQPGVTLRGMINHTGIAREFQRAGVWAYSTSFEETGCLTAVKARAGGVVPVCPPLAALEETAACPEGYFVDPRDEEHFVDACVRATEVTDEARARMRAEAIDKFQISRFLPRWKEILS